MVASVKLSDAVGEMMREIHAGREVVVAETSRVVVVNLSISGISSHLSFAKKLSGNLSVSPRRSS